MTDPRELLLDEEIILTRSERQAIATALEAAEADARQYREALEKVGCQNEHMCDASPLALVYNPETGSTKGWGLCVRCAALGRA